MISSKKGIFKAFDYDQTKLTFNAMLIQTAGKTMRLVDQLCMGKRYVKQESIYAVI